ncbi:MAG: hypothetical protein KAJ19_23600 [Gammaproteobacteria bacterium]|nr:hypothetical protein [Gammaproteobacteria bacterium]
MKDLVKTKTFQGAIASILIGVGMYLSGEETAGIQTAMVGIMAIFGRHAIAKIPSK